MRRDDHIVGYAPYEQRIRPIVSFTIALAAVTVLVLFLMKIAASTLEREASRGSRPVHPLAETGKVEQPPEPRLQESPALDLARFRAREEERLSTYAWVDRPNGVVRIPIERAMELVAREGLPARPPDREGNKR
jgi:hypothetical protein